eukprot:1134217-Pelagomonas_calceolata.AAC.2
MPHNGLPTQIRVGIHTGPAVTGMVDLSADTDCQETQVLFHEVLMLHNELPTVLCGHPGFYFILDDNNVYVAQCLFCKTSLRCKLQNVKAHESGEKHKERAAAWQQAQPVLSFCMMSCLVSLESCGGLISRPPGRPEAFEQKL